MVDCWVFAFTKPHWRRLGVRLLKDRKVKLMLVILCCKVYITTNAIKQWFTEILQWITCSTLALGHTKRQIISSKPFEETRNRSLSGPKVFSKTEISFLSSWNLDICLVRAQKLFNSQGTFSSPSTNRELFIALLEKPLTLTWKIHFRLQIVRNSLKKCAFQYPKKKNLDQMLSSLLDKKKNF